MEIAMYNQLKEAIEKLGNNNYKYDVQFIGSVCSGTEEGDNGMFNYVELDGEEREYAYMDHRIEVCDIVICCEQAEEMPEKWLINDDEALYAAAINQFPELERMLKEIVKFVDFEDFAIDSFDGHCIAEAVPYGDPYSLLIDDCVYIIEEYDKNSDKESDDKLVRQFLKERGWESERIESAIAKGYEISDDVYSPLSELAIEYMRPSEKL